VIVVECVIPLIPEEPVRLESDRLTGLYQQLGEAGAEDVVCRAVEELAVRLTHCDQLWRTKDWSGLRKSAKSLVAISDQIGMNTLARVARDVTVALDNADEVAVAATFTRLIRTGERSLTAIWDLHDVSV
jgi:hypothetical protein